MSSKMDMILKQLPTALPASKHVFVVATELTPDVRRVEEYVDECNKDGVWVKLRVANGLRDSDVPPTTAVIILMANVTEGTMLHMKKRARHRDAPCCCLSASLTKNQLKVVLEALDKIRERQPAVLITARNEGKMNGNGHNGGSKEPFVVDIPQVSLTGPTNGRPMQNAEPVASAAVSADVVGDDSSEAVDPEAILKDLDGLTASATEVLKQVDRAQNGIILLAGKVDTLKLENEELREQVADKDRELARLRQEADTSHSAAIAEKDKELRTLRDQVAAFEIEMRAYNDLKESLLPFADMLAKLKR